jgi:hypothetical protein
MDIDEALEHRLRLILRPTKDLGGCSKGKVVAFEERHDRECGCGRGITWMVVTPQLIERDHNAATYAGTRTGQQVTTARAPRELGDQTRQTPWTTARLTRDPNSQR